MIHVSADLKISLKTNVQRWSKDCRRILFCKVTRPYRSGHVWKLSLIARAYLLPANYFYFLETFNWWKINKKSEVALVYSKHVLCSDLSIWYHNVEDFFNFTIFWSVRNIFCAIPRRSSHAKITRFINLNPITHRSVDRQLTDFSLL